MAFVVTCPSCKARLKTMVMAPAGTLSECPRCLTQFTLTEDTPELLEKKTPPLKSSTNASIKVDRAAGAETGTPIKPKLKKNRDEDESEGVQPRSQKKQLTYDAVKDRDVPKRQARRDDAEEMEERAPSGRSKTRKKKNNPLFLVLAISLPLLLIVGGGVGYAIYAFRQAGASGDELLTAMSNDSNGGSGNKLSAGIPLKREVKAGSSVGTQHFVLDTIGEPADRCIYRIKYKNENPPAEEFYLVSSYENGEIVGAGALDMRGRQQVEYVSDRELGKHIYVWIGKSQDGSLVNFIRVSNIVHVVARQAGSPTPARGLTPEAPVGAEEVSIERTNAPGEGMHFNVKFKNGRVPSEELSLVITTDGGQFLEASLLEMFGKPETRVTLDKVALPGKTVHIWVGRPVNGSLSKFTRVSNIVQIAGK